MGCARVTPAVLGHFFQEPKAPAERGPIPEALISVQVGFSSSFLYQTDKAHFVAGSDTLTLLSAACSTYIRNAAKCLLG